MTIVRKDIRTRRRNENFRMVEKPEDLKLTRRASGDAPAETIKAAVLAALLLGGAVSEVAKLYNLEYATVYRWKRDFDITSPAKRRDRLTEMLVEFVEEELISLSSISITTRNEEWLLLQNASDLAHYVAAKEDRLLALLAAYGKAQQPLEPQQPIHAELVDSEMVDIQGEI